jgi:hypothetical protein
MDGDASADGPVLGPLPHATAALTDTITQTSRAFTCLAPANLNPLRHCPSNTTYAERTKHLRMRIGGSGEGRDSASCGCLLRGLLGSCRESSSPRPGSGQAFLECRSW